MKKIKIILEAVLVIAVVMALILPSSAVIINNDTKTQNLNMYLTEIEEPISIGGPITAKAEKLPLLCAPKNTGKSSRDMDIQVTYDEDFQGNPALAIDSDGTMLLAYEYEEDILERAIHFATSTDGGEIWDIHFYTDVSGIEELSASDYGGLVDDMQNFHVTWLCSENNYGDAYHMEILDVNNPDIEFWLPWVNSWSEHGFFEFSSCDITALDKNVGETEGNFVMSWVGSFEGLTGYPDCYQVPFYQIRSAPDTSTILWFYYNYSANGRMDIDRTAEIIYYAFEWDNEADQDVILLSSELQYVGEVEPQGWGDGMGEGRKYAIEGTANTRNPAIAAENNYVYLIVQTDVAGNEDIVCYYSSDGGDNYEMSVIADTNADERFPEVYATGEDAFCVFTSLNDLYLAETHDGGQTWEISDETINDEAGTVVEQYKCADLYIPGVVWSDERYDDGDVFFDRIFLNDPPNTPTIDGPNTGKTGQSVTFKFKATDPDGDKVRFIIDWGDEKTKTTTFVASGTEKTETHTWETEEEFTIKVYAEDENGGKGPTATHKINIPRNRAKFYNLFDIFPNLFRLLNLIFG